MKTPTILSTAFLALAMGSSALADVFILPDGTMLVTDGPGSTKVSRKNNLLFIADGSITTEDGCKTGETPVPHFHGTLGGKKDDGKACGHGKVKLLPNAGDTKALASLLENLSTAVNIIIGGKWGAECAPNGDTAISAIEGAIEQFPGITTVIKDKVKDKKKREKLIGKANSLKGKLAGAKFTLELGGELTAGQAKKQIDQVSTKIEKKIKKFFKDLQKEGVF